MQQLNIEEQALKTYRENLLFFQETDLHLFNKIKAFEVALEKGYYKERYSLEYKDEGYFDVLEMESSNYLYGENSKAYAKKVANSIDFQKEGNLFETFYKVQLQDEHVDSYKEAPLTDSSYAASAPIINYANNHAQQPRTEMKKIYKFIFFGTGLGSHLLETHKKLQSNIYFIVEDDLELFRLSLFVTPYKELTDNGAKLFFSIFDDIDIFKIKAQEFFNEMFVYNQYLKFFAMLNHSEIKIKEFQKLILEQGYLVFNYAAMTLSIIRPLEHLKEKFKIVDISGTPLKNTPINTKPVLILGAGPSLHQNLSWLKENQHKFIIVAVSAMMSLLEENNIKPAIITHTHGFDDALPHVQKVKDMEFFKDTLLLFAAFTTPKFLSYFKKENIFLFQGTSEFKRRFSGLGASNIGALTYGLITKFGMKNIYLLGLDFALNQETGASHSSSHEYVKHLDTEKTTYEIEDKVDYINSVVLTKGNFQEEVTTNIMFSGFKRQCELFHKVYATDETNTYNLSDGAFIEGTTPLKPADKKIQSLKDIGFIDTISTLKEIFDKHSENYLTQEDIDSLEKKLQYVQNLQNILTEYEKRKLPTMYKFHHALLGLFIDILGEDKNREAYEINNVFEYYLKYVSGYLFDIINTKGLKNEKHHIKALNKIIISQLRKILDFYEEYFSDYLKDARSTSSK
jgi:hypothetical protein